MPSDSSDVSQSIRPLRVELGEILAVQFDEAGPPLHSTQLGVQKMLKKQ